MWAIGKNRLLQDCLKHYLPKPCGVHKKIQDETVSVCVHEVDRNSKSVENEEIEKT